MVPWSIYLGIIALAAGLYSTTIYCGFTWDDRAAVVSNIDVIGKTTLIELLQHDFWGQNITAFDSHKSYRPLTTLSFRFDYSLFGPSSAGFHISSTIIYCIVCAVFLKLCSLCLLPQGISLFEYEN